MMRTERLTTPRAIPRVASPLVSLLVALAIAVFPAALLAVGTAETAQAQAAPPVAPASERVVGVEDFAGKLSDSDKEMLRTETARLSLPPQVTRVEYLLFDKGDDNLNNTVERYGAEQRNELLADDKNKWAPGLLIVAISFDPRKNGIYCGDNVCAALDIFDGPHLAGSIEKMVDPLKRGNYAAGLLAGATAAADPTVTKEKKNPWPWVLGIGGAVLAFIGVGTAWGVSHSRKTKAATAREQYDEVSKEYGRTARELDGLDIRANSLTSPLADDELRSQWEEVKARFLEVDEIMSRIGELGPTSDDKAYRAAADDIGTAHQAVTDMGRAETNIDDLFRMEQGDATVRRRELGELREDVLKAALETKDEKIEAEARAVATRIEELGDSLEAPDFMDRFARIVVDYRVVVDAIRKAELSDVESSEERSAPRLYDSGWRIGYGYQGYVPYAMVSTWHTEDVAAQSSSSSSGVNTSYSNSSFSGGGGSGSW